MRCCLIFHSLKRFQFGAHQGTKTNLLNLQRAIIPALHCNDPLFKGWQISLRVSRPLLSCTICLYLILSVLQCLGNRLYLVLRNSQSSFPLTAHLVFSLSWASTCPSCLCIETRKMNWKAMHVKRQITKAKQSKAKNECAPTGSTFCRT